MTDLPTVRAAIKKLLHGAVVWKDLDADMAEPLLDAILTKLSDPAVQDELARWLIAQEDGPFKPSLVHYFGDDLLYCLRQRTRNEEQK